MHLTLQQRPPTPLRGRTAPPLWHHAPADRGPTAPTDPRRLRHWERVTTRWADIDVYGHMNNARYFELIDTVVNNHLAEAIGRDIRGLDAIGVVAEVSCRYFAEVGYPEPVDVGVVVDQVGRSSVVYRVGLFQGEDGCCGRGQVRPRVRRQHRPGAAGDRDAGRGARAPWSRCSAS